MKRIAVCDDEQRCIDDVLALISEYRQLHPDLETEVHSYSTSGSLLSAREKKSFDVYILDVYIDAMSGVDIAGEIRKDNDEAAIIFLTTSGVHYRDAFRVKAAHYLEKPVDKQEFFEALDRVFDDASEKYYAAKDIDGLTKVRLSDIYYILSEDHYKSIVTPDKSFLVRGTMQEIMEGIGDESFYLLNNKVILNLKRMKKINSSEIEMEDGKIFPVPRGCYRSISDLFLKYSFE
ncbi:MAG: LytTR family DNA-binding domain-containing protein [Lachnospiraceae bacterium]|nr:LytTR family DNA-binding domain-containing protein [Lachnospiraceae bacterium]